MGQRPAIWHDKMGHEFDIAEAIEIEVTHTWAEGSAERDRERFSNLLKVVQRIAKAMPRDAQETLVEHFDLTLVK